MKFSCIFFVLILGLSSYSFCTDLVSFDECSFKYENTELAKKEIIQDDPFITNLTDFDLSARLKTSKQVTIEEYKLYLSNQVLDWNSNEKNKLENILSNLKDKLNDLNISTPKEILLIKTTGHEEGNAAYCRGNNVIVLPISYINMQQSELQDIVLHELFHIFSRNNLPLQEKLYNSIGFSKITELELPQDVKKWKITNPDAVLNNYCFISLINNTEYKVVPILLASSKYDENKGGEFFDYLSLYFMAIEEKDGKTLPLVINGSYLIFGVSKITNYFDIVGNNTDYIIHPEEILADNFVLLVNKSKNIKTKKVTKAINEILMK